MPQLLLWCMLPKLKQLCQRNVQFTSCPLELYLRMIDYIFTSQLRQSLLLYLSSLSLLFIFSCLKRILHIFEIVQISNFSFFFFSISQHQNTLSIHISITSFFFSLVHVD
ncbi:unnamed protein product (macronuclear) [Paramecium tetraurelia]|uniref:Uncharacterized protein n=1 Tax=Paramecium tetraurelia TaxID=5888 RepID=A0CSP4_PARTE|nr:uncharacterized protein GSPATT00010083001 [Paramecium tetraurelia]CAK73811.1 unnamed protein product [Paramecium tetraurelia]|eukprot:XP_001441208.1 hypothetical protein (macronuclear) [Paramecium tetraurelia strain d4-2]